MKLHPDGSIEGSPAECAEYERIRNERMHKKPFKLPGPINIDFVKKLEKPTDYPFKDGTSVIVDQSGYLYLSKLVDQVYNMPHEE